MDLIVIGSNAGTVSFVIIPLVDTAPMPNDYVNSSGSSAGCAKDTPFDNSLNKVHTAFPP